MMVLTETRFVHDGNNVVLELDDVGTVEADFTYIPPPMHRCSVSIGIWNPDSTCLTAFTTCGS